MRICYFSDARAIHVQRWIEYFRDKGHEIHLISTVEGYIKGIKVYNINLLDLNHTRSRVKRRWERLKKICMIRSIISTISPDIIHIHFLYNNPVVFAFTGFRNLIISLWGSDIVYDQPHKEPFKIKFIKRFILNQASEITATSNFLAEITAKYVSKNKPVHVIPFGVDLEWFKRGEAEKKNGKEITIAFIKHLRTKYGSEYLIKAMPKVLQKHQNVRLLMIGGGELEPKLKRVVKELGIGDHVEFVGVIPNQKVRDYLKITDIFVMPSIYESESFGVAAVESSAMGVPIIASRIGGVSEVVEHGKSGILVKPRDPDELANAILTLIENPNLRISMGEKGRELVVKKYDWNKNAHQMERLYEKTLWK